MRGCTHPPPLGAVAVTVTVLQRPAYGAMSAAAPVMVRTASTPLAPRISILAWSVLSKVPAGTKMRTENDTVCAAADTVCLLMTSV